MPYGAGAQYQEFGLTAGSWARVRCGLSRSSPRPFPFAPSGCPDLRQTTVVGFFDPSERTPVDRAIPS